MTEIQTPLTILKKYWGYDSFREIQEDVINSVMSGKDTLAFARTSMGKALHKDTIVQTPTGPVTMGSLSVNDYVIGADGKSTKVINKFQPKVKDHYLLTFKNGEQVKSCGDHLWKINAFRANLKDEILNTRQIYSLLSNSRIKVSINNTEIVSCYSEKQLKIHPYLFGLWLGDGTTKTTGISSSQEDSIFYIKYLENLQYEVSCKSGRTCSTLKVYQNTFNYLGEPCKLNALRKKLFEDKFSKTIPNDYLYSSVEQRLDLIAGLLDSDGCFEDSSVMFYNTNYKLVEQVRVIIHSLGMKTTLSSKVGKYKDRHGNIVNCKTCYRLRIIPNRQLFKLERKAAQLQTFLDSSFKYRCNLHYIDSIVKIEDHVDDYYCISVDNEDKLFLITDSFIPTHNTVTFQVPALLLDGITLVISPLLALQKDQVDNCIEKGIPVAMINSETGVRARKKLKQQLENKEIKILYVAPETILGDNFSDILPLLDVSLIAVDEAHCCSQWSDFRPKYKEVYRLREEFFPNARLLAVTATADDAVKKDIIKYIGFNSDYNLYQTSFDRPSINYHVIHITKPPTEYILKLIRMYPKGTAGIIYSGSRAKSEEMASFLKLMGYNAICYHAGMKKKEKTEAQTKYLSGEVDIVCATIAFGMGIDKSNIRYVIHTDPPHNFESAAQEFGRASRDGLPSSAYILYSPVSFNSAQWLIRQTTPNPDRLAVKLKKLKDFHSFCRSSSCLRVQLLAQFGEKYPNKKCGKCGNCGSELLNLGDV